MSILKYLDTNSKQTLKEGIVELRKSELENDATEQLAVELLRDIDEHDAIHVLFACPTDLNGEIFAHVWSLFGTTMSVDQMKKVNSHTDHKVVLKNIGHFKLLRIWLLHLPQIFRIIVRAKRMHKKFPVENFEKYLNVDLQELRKSFGIKIIE